VSTDCLGSLDDTPPILTKFDAVPEMEASKQLATLRVHYAATDDMSGIFWIVATALGPNGELVLVYHDQALPATSLTGVLAGVDTVQGFESPGTYIFTSAYLYDAAGNMSALDQAQLATLGNTAVAVSNKRGFDSTVPTLVNGVILTPKVSMSARHPGTDQPPYFSLALGAEDSGGSIVAGLRSASAAFCLRDGATCIQAWNNLDVPRQASALLNLAGQLSADDVPGEYRLMYVQLLDFAFNSVQYRSIEFGGTTDFRRYFPSTTITVKP